MKKLIIKTDRCKGCGACVTQCRAGALSLDIQTDNRKKISLKNHRCDACGDCISYCRYGALVITDESSC